MATLVYRTLATAQSTGGAVTPTGLESYVVNQALVNVEKGQPEGMRLELLMPNLGQFAPRAANALQAKFLVGQVKDPATGTPIIPWPEYPNVLADTPIGQSGTLRVRWVKGQWEIPLIIGIAVTIIGYLLIRSLAASPYSLKSAAVAGASGTTGGTPIFGGTPFRILYLPWYDALAGGVLLAAAPFVIHKLAQTETSSADLIRGERTLRAAERGS